MYLLIVMELQDKGFDNFRMFIKKLMYKVDELEYILQSNIQVSICYI